MADYPGSVYAPRTKQNKSGVIYTPLVPTTLFAEDITLLDSEIVAVETDLISKLNQAVKTDSSPSFHELTVGEDITQLLGQTTIVLNFGGGDFNVTFPSITPETNPIFGQNILIINGVLTVLTIDSAQKSLAFTHYDSVLKTIEYCSVSFITDVGDYSYLRMSGELQVGDDSNPSAMEAIIKTKTITFPDTGSGSFGVKFLTGFDTLGTGGIGFEGSFIFKGIGPGSDALLAFCNSDLEYQGFLGYSDSFETFVMFGGANGPYVGPFTRVADCDVLTLNLIGFLGTNQTGDIGRIPFRVAHPGSLFSVPVNCASIDLVCTYVGSDYPTDIAVSAALDFSTMPLTGTLTHVMRISELQRVGIGNQNPLHKLHVTGDCEIEQENTSIITDELVIDMTSQVADLYFTVPVLDCNAKSSLPDIYPFSHALCCYDYLFLCDNSGLGTVSMLFSNLAFTVHGDINCNINENYFSVSMQFFPDSNASLDLGGASHQWRDLRISRKIIVGGTSAVVDGTYTVGIGGTQNGTITVKGGIITAVQEAS